MMGPLDEPYLQWLTAKVNYREHYTPSTNFSKLMLKLYCTEFPWLVSGDDNRAADGKQLRDQFLMETGYPDDPEWRAMPCSVLEMLIAFSRVAEFNTGFQHAAQWFWEMLENLRVDMPDADYNEGAVEDALHRFVWRDYVPNGQGGLFPIRNPIHDQRRVEIWYQFCDYLMDQSRLP